jgi:lipoate-protein ligase A
MEQWTLLDTGVKSAAENVALDDTLLTCRSRNLIPNTFRFLQFSPHNVLVGFHQTVEQEVRVDYCKQRKIDINRRITGGGAIYLDEPQLGWEVIATRNHSLKSKGMEELYDQMCECTVKGLNRLGIEAKFRPKNDIEVNGRKISGTGGAFEGNAFLFQGTLLTDFDVNTMLRALRIPLEKLKDKEIESVRERVTCLKWELGYVPKIESIKTIIKEEFAKIFNTELQERVLTQDEKILFEKKIKHYQSNDWIYGVRRPMKHRQLLMSAYKAPGGLIRTSLIVDIPNKRIQAALITGDFFIHPKRTIFDLEAILKDFTMEEKEIKKKILNFFKEREVEIPGIVPQDFINAILKTIEKIDYLKLGIPFENVNNIFTVLDSIHNINEPSVLLIPYCAKLPECKYRQEKDCNKCGKCTVSDAYELAEQKGLNPITVLNFEDLIQTLNVLKQKGTKAFVGSCCEAFYAKHQDDFQQAGLPGILIDIDSQTCYDLGKERDAKKGKFENQTNLRMELIQKIVEYLR